MEQKIVSILIPCYNHERYVEHAIRSALNQTYKNIEVLVSDDCSTDNSREVILSIKDDRIKFYPFDINLGVVHALNFLMKKATGDYIIAIGSDDYLDEAFVETGLGYFENDDKLGAVFSKPYIINENDEQLDPVECFGIDIFNIESTGQGQMLRRFYIEGNRLCAPTSIIRKSACDEVGIYNYAYRQIQDFDYWCRLLCKYRIMIIPERLLYYRKMQHGNLSEGTDSSINRTKNEMILMYKSLFEIMPENVFYEGFSDLIPEEYQSIGIPTEVKKYIVLRQLRPCNIDMLLSSILYFESNINSNTLEQLPDKGGAIIKQFYTDTGKDCYSIADFNNESIEKNTAEELRKQKIISNIKKCAAAVAMLSSAALIAGIICLIGVMREQPCTVNIRTIYCVIIASAIVSVLVIFMFIAYKVLKKVKWALYSKKA